MNKATIEVDESIPDGVIRMNLSTFMAFEANTRNITQVFESPKEEVVATA